MTSVLQDKDEIRELLHQYCFCMDEGRFAELGALFADDGEWVAPYRQARGPADHTTRTPATSRASASARQCPAGHSLCGLDAPRCSTA